MAASQAAVIVVLAILLTIILNQPGCRSNESCPFTVLLWALVIAIPIVVGLAWWWGRWYARKAEATVLQLKRDYSQQAAVVEFQSQRLQTVMHHMADGVVLINGRGEVGLINQAACDLFNVSEKKAIGQLFSAVVWQHQLIDLWQVCRESGEEQRRAIELDRRQLFIEAIITPIIQEDQSNYLLVLQDLTRIHRLESIRRDFIGNVSHELLTPIASVRAVVETLQDGALADEVAATRFLGRAADEVDSMTQLVTELLTLTRIESGVTEFKFAAVPVSELLLRPVERLSEQALRKNIDLIVNAGSDLPLVNADCEQVWQVIRNLLHNAIKHTKNGGKVQLSAQQQDGMIEISIKDNGVGIHPDDLPRIFERFYKADRSRNRGAVSGTGLGLAIVKHIVLAHNGRFWAESKLGKGSTFTFSLPTIA